MKCRIGIISGIIFATFVAPSIADAQGWAYFRAHIHRTGKCFGAREVGASVYNEPGKRTFTGEPFRALALRAAVPAVDGWPMHASISITNPRNGKQVTVTANDRLPHKGDAFRSGVRLDLTPAAHKALGMKASDWVCASS